MSKGSWGIEVSQSFLKATRLEFIKGRVELTDLEIISYTPMPSRDEAALEQEIRLALDNFISRHKLKRIKRDIIAASLPSHSTFNRTIKLSVPSPERVRDIIRYEAQQHIPFPLEEVIWTYQIIERTYQPGEEIEVVLFAIKKELVDQFLALMALSGISVDIVQFAPVALYNYVNLELDLGESFVILDMGANNTDLILVDNKGFWVRNLPIVGNDLTKAIQQKFDLSFVDAENMKINISEAQQAGKVFSAIQPILSDLVSEIHRSIGYYKSLTTGSRVPNFSKIVLVGNATRTIYFDEFVSQRLQLESVRLKQLNKIDVGPGVELDKVNNQLPSLGVALGLALQGLNLTSNRINLVPPEVTKAKIIARRKPFIAASLGVVAFILMILFLSARHTYQYLTSALKPPREFLQNWEKENKELITLLNKISSLETNLKTISQITSDRNIWNKIFSALEEVPALQKNIPLPNFYIEKDNPQDLAKLMEFKKKKIWILQIEAVEEIISPSKSAEDDSLGTKTQIKLTLICGVVCRTTSDGTPDLKSSQAFVKENLVLPLAERFKTAVSDPIPLYRGNPVAQLRTEKEGFSTSEEQPKYYIFSVSFEILI